MENKELLLKDLCARLPYGLYIQDEYGDIVYVSYNNVHFTNYFDSILNGTIKPYLFPLSSMTWEQECQYREVIASSLNHYEVYDWLNKNHFDYRGLIEKGLALDATGLNIY